MRVRFGDTTFDSASRSLQRAGGVVHLSAKAFRLLEVLIEARPRTVPKQEILEKVWPDTFVSETNLPTLVKEIRAAIGDDARESRILRTAHGFGYAFAAEAFELPDEPQPVESIAILPFENLTGTPEWDFLADGLSEALINALASIPRLRVSPRGTSFRYRGREGEPQTLRRELNVQVICTGRLRLAIDVLTLQVELTDLRQESQLWGRQLQAPPAAVLRLQDELVREVGVALRLKGSSTAGLQAKRYSTKNESYQLYLKGRHHWNRRTLEGIERGIFYFQSAIDSDPAYAPAFSGLADSYVALASRDLLPPAQLFTRAQEAARRAIELDPELAEAHASMAATHEVFGWNWREAEREFLEALRLNPNYQMARQWYALALAHQGRTADGLAQLEIAKESDPLSVMINTNAALVHYLAREYDEAEESCARAIEINPHNEPSRFVLGLSLEQRGKHAEARVELERALAISRGEPHVIAALGHLEGASDPSAAHERLRTLAALSGARHVSQVHPATIHASLGEIDEAFTALQEAFAARSGWLVYLRTEPRFDPLRGDSRYGELLERLKS